MIKEINYFEKKIFINNKYYIVEHIITLVI